MTSRDKIQQQFVDLWISKNYHLGLAAITGFGKTRVSIMCALQSNAVKTTVIVPTKDLKQQWLLSLSEWKVPNYEVYVVNTAAKLKLETDFLIIDEAHTSGMADWFQLSWTNAKFNKLLWLSATPERKDNKHKKLFQIAPKGMSITFEQALSEGWIANYDMFNVGINLTTAEKVIHGRIEYDLEKLYLKMHHHKPNVVDVSYIKKNAFDIAGEFISSGEWKKISIGKDYYKLIGERKFLLYNAEEKLTRTVNYINKNSNEKILVFSQSQEFADKLQEVLGDICVTIHSGLKDKERELNLKKFRDKRTKIRVISSIKALNEGIDLPELTTGICASGTSSKKDAVQMLGRVTRLNGDKHAKFFNLYCKGTQDLYWLNNRQYSLDKNKIKWI